MELGEYAAMRRMEDTYWWYVAKRHLVWSMLRGRVPSGARFLDLGCGTGAMSAEIAARYPVVSLDYELTALDFARDRGLSRIVRGSAEALPFPDSTFDAITALDVIEHLDHDEFAVAEIGRVLRPGGAAVITVPAFPFLWTEHDVALHHRRRYRARGLRRLFDRAGLTVDRLSYEMTALFPVAATLRLLKRAVGTNRKPASAARASLPLAPGPLNVSLIALMRLEAALVRHVDLPFGLSLVAVVFRPLSGMPRQPSGLGRV